jgi:hypothetical protein
MCGVLTGFAASPSSLFIFLYENFFFFINLCAANVILPSDSWRPWSYTTTFQAKTVLLV